MPYWFHTYHFQIIALNNFHWNQGKLHNFRKEYTCTGYTKFQRFIPSSLFPKQTLEIHSFIEYCSLIEMQSLEIHSFTEYYSSFEIHSSAEIYSVYVLSLSLSNFYQPTLSIMRDCPVLLSLGHSSSLPINCSLLIFKL